MPNKIEYPDDVINEIKNMIYEGKGCGEIISKFPSYLTWGRTKQISKQLGINDILKKNNKECYKKRYINILKIKRIKRFTELNNKFGNEIKDMINNGAILNDLIKKFNIGPIPMTKFLDYIGYNEKRKENSKKYLVILARKNGAKSAHRKNLEVKPITLDMEKRFLELKAQNMGLAAIVRIFRQEYGYGIEKVKQLRTKFGLMRTNQSGKNNPMYGKSPGNNSGKGITGHIIIGNKKVIFRSLLELKIFLFFLEKNILFNLSGHRVKFIFNSKERTYCPDIVINTIIYEIKPQNLLKLEINKIKFNALEEYCKKFNLKCQYITEKTYDISNITIEYIKNKINDNIIIISEKNIERLVKQNDRLYCRKN